MRIRAGIIGAAIAGLAMSAHAQSSHYVTMAVAGSHNGWATTPNMVLVSNNIWVTTQTISSASGQFKFAANNSWTTNWGGNAVITRVPAAAVAPSLSSPTYSPPDLNYAGLTPGSYRFIFNDTTQDFRIDRVGAPLPLPTPATLALVGDFNSWTPSPSSMLTNHTADTNLWSLSLTLEDATAFQFQLDGDAANQWGAPEPAALSIPVADASACGKSPFSLAGFPPGTFRFELNVSNATFSIVQTATQAFTIATMAVQGNFIGSANPPANMTRLGDTASWESDHHITTNMIASGGTASFRFAANGGVVRWGTTNGAPAAPLPASGALAAALTNFSRASGIVPGRYRITFNHLTGAFTFRLLYSDASGLNLLKNPSFEQTTQDDGGYAVDWGAWQALPKRVADGYAPHSGTWCGAIFGKMLSDWTDYGSLSQDVLIASGKTYRASAWFRGSSNWTATTMQIKIEWMNATNGPVGGEKVVQIPSLSTNWVKYAVEGAAPSGATKAHVVFLCSGAGTNGTMQIDDAEMRAVAGRAQNFDTWGALSSYGAFAPDWSITSGKTVWNVPPGRPPADVFISQYVEGSNNNKAIEIYNGTLSNLDLAAQNYVLEQFDNGSTNPTTSIALSGVIAAGSSLVVARPSSPTNYAPDVAISGLPNLLTNKSLTFNGDDVVVLRKGGPAGVVKDRVGQVGANASGSIWSRTTKDHTLVRKSTIFTGTVNAVTSAFPLVEEWSVSASDTFDDLGTHDISYLDPNEPYTPAGYSLIMNTNATLMSGELPGGVGDLTFWYRTESMSPAVTMSIETAPAEDGPWTTNATLSGVASSNFAYYVAAINRADALYLRIRQTAGATNRFRIDEILASEPSTTRRTEDFSAWTDPSYEIPGSYSRYGWTLQSASISSNNGVLDSRSARLSPPDSQILSPSFEAGLGEVRFWAKAAESGTAHLLLQTTVDGGTNWIPQASFTVTTSKTQSAWLYILDPGAQARLLFDPAQSSSDVFVDNIEIRLPELFRDQNFDGWSPSSSYVHDTYQGWTIDNCIVDSQNAYEGQVARLGTTLNNYIQSPFLPDGVGTLRFRSRKWSDSDAAFTLQLQVSSNASAWTTLATFSPSSTNYEQFTYFIQSDSNHHVRLLHSAGAVRALVDDIQVGVPQPRPEVLVAPGLDPENPLIGEPTTLIADVVTRYDASILSVTGYYRIDIGSTNLLAMSTEDQHAYASTSDIPGQDPGAQIRYFVQVRYAGVGAASNSTTFTTNTYISPTLTNFVSTVPQGSVWVNELFYSAYGTNEPYIVLTNDPWIVYTGCNHEYIELCGAAGSDIGGWTLQLAFGADADIAANGGQPVYASYRIPTNTILADQTNGFGFYVFGDQPLASNQPIDTVFTTLVPSNVNYYAELFQDHFYDGVGVIRLLNQFSNVVFSLSYVGFAPLSERIPQTQNSSGETNSIGMTGVGNDYYDFSWGKGSLSIGAENDGQDLQKGTNDDVFAWSFHNQAQLVEPSNTNFVPIFHMLDPFPAAHWDMLSIYYGYSNASYIGPAGTLYHRKNGDTTWNTLSMTIREGAADSNGFGYVRAQIPPRAYKRLQTIEYVIEIAPNTTGVLNSYLGGNGSNVSTLYTNFEGAAAHPFTYLVPIADTLYITNFAVGRTNVLLQTEGNDFYDPLTNFYVQFNTNPLTQYYYIYDSQTNIIGTRTNATWGTWINTNFTHALNSQSQSMFNVRRSTSTWPKATYRIVTRGQ